MCEPWTFLVLLEFFFDWSQTMGTKQDFMLQLLSLDNELNKSVVLADGLDEEVQYNFRVIGDKHGKTCNGSVTIWFSFHTTKQKLFTIKDQS